MSFPYKNPISSIQVNGTQSVPRNNTYGTTFSVNNTGGYMEVYSLSDLYYTIPSGTTGSIEYSGNTIPIEFTKGTGVAWSPDVITLASDNISSGRRRLGMLVYVYEQDQVYQYYINNYETLFNAATASTGCAQVSDFGTTINNKTAAGQSFINAWTGNTIEDVSGATHTTAVWRKFSSGSSSGGTSGTSLYIVGTGINSTVRCGVNNTASGDYGASLAGCSNTASGKYSFVGGGISNSSTDSYSIVSGGYQNTASNTYTFVGGGRNNTASGSTSTISGGYCNINGGDSSFIGAGRCNTMFGMTGGVIGGGASNTVSSNYSFIGGGSNNTVSGYISFVGGGLSNTASGSYSFIVGGSTNTVSGDYSFIGGGNRNTIYSYPSPSSSFSSILNGCLNTISGTGKMSNSIVIGGLNNFISDSFIGVFGCNIVASCPNTFYTNNFCSCGSIYSSALSSGQAVCTGTNGLLTNYTPVSSVIIQGSCTTSSIRCGVSNNATASFSAALAGTGNTSSGLASVVVGGAINNTYSTYSFVGGGIGNKSCGNSTSVVGGSLNTACCATSFIGGGQQNITSGVTSSVVGGFCNIAGGNCSFIGGGTSNIITSGGTFSFIGEGRGNTVSGSYGMVLGGSGNTITGSFSSAIGCGLNASANCTLYTNNIITGTISATTYQNLPSFSGGSITGLTINGNLTVTGNTSLKGLTATTISATTYQNLPYSGTVTGSGTINYLPRWTGTTALGRSVIQDDGTNIGVSVTPSSSYKMYVYTLTNPTTLYVQNQTSGGIGISVLVNGGGSPTAISASSQGSVGSNNTGILGVAQDGLLAIGVKGTLDTSEFGGITTGIGGYFDARAIGGYSSPSSAYSVQLLDGTEGVNKVLLSTTSDGKANWSSVLTGLTNVRSTTISATTYQNLPSFSGGSITGLTINGNLTVTGNTSLQALTATTISATTITASTLATSFTTGSVIFQGSGGTLTQNNSNLFWDNVNNRFGVGTALPTGAVTIIGAYSSNTAASLVVQNTLAYGGTANQYSQMWLNSTGGVMGYVRNDGRLYTSNDINSNYFVANATGSASTPIFKGSGANGMYFPVTNNIAFTTNGVEVLRMFSGQNISIGTTADFGYRVDVRGATRFSASTGTSLTVISSGNSTSVPVFSVQGSQGELFSVTDSLTGSLFSVSDISGLPIMEVFSDSTTIIGDYQSPSLYTTKRVSSITATTGTTIYSFPTSAYTSSYVDYNVSGTTGLRAGNIMAIWSGTSVNFTETSTNDIGVTTPLTFGYVISGSSAVLQASASTGTWIVKSILRGL
ncbi:hypothetical protein UFOVP117_60 [uncultured Caudovirales phage]|uniref:Uncharacterized protein n=1 Tax=uncultured Caudovirales phage TaxID=2100421 RepID=A0A6J5L6I5_9CAUD|nr:hypothetical protein UFOVP117_60 [uncultured Caudovirales phage]